MSKARILVDMDGVLADFEGELERRWNERWPDDDTSLMRDRVGFEFGDNIDIENNFEKFFKLYKEPGLFAELNEQDDGLGLQRIQELLDLDYDVRIVTSAGTQPHVFSEKAHWIEERLGRVWVQRLVVTRDKHFVDGAVLIDDRPNAAKGNESRWQQIIYDHPYNRHVKDHPRLSWSDDDWLETIESTVAQVQAER